MKYEKISKTMEHTTRTGIVTRLTIPKDFAEMMNMNVNQRVKIELNPVNQQLIISKISEEIR